MPSIPTTTPQAEDDDPYAPPTTLQGMPKSVVLYQYDVCPFCCKVKAFLDYNGVCHWDDALFGHSHTPYHTM